MSLAEEIRQLRSEVKRLNKENKQERMKFIALKTCDGGAKGRISFCCKTLKVTRQGANA